MRKAKRESFNEESWTKSAEIRSEEKNEKEKREMRDSNKELGNKRKLHSYGKVEKHTNTCKD